MLTLTPCLRVFPARDDQIIFGRRGTGKTHALLYLAETLRGKGQTVVYVDLRLLGSTGGIYSDAGISVSEAGTRLLLDALHQIYEELVEQVFAGSASEESTGDLALTRLDAFSEATAEVAVIGETEHRIRAGFETTSETAQDFGGHLGPSGPRLSAFSSAKEAGRFGAEKEIRLRGIAQHRVHFGSVGNSLRRLVPTLAGQRLWLLLDEWSHIPLHLQPLLADLLRHCVLPIPGVTVKIAAIDQRSTFKLDRDDGSYVGLELGADIAADIDLDEFMVFSYERDAAVDFFSQLFHRHISAATEQDTSAPQFAAASGFVDSAFASTGAFRELVRAAEGVPRDAINIAGKAALHADSTKITLEHVRDAARGWYMLDKEAGLRTRPDARYLLHWIIDRVISGKKARAFLIRQGSESHRLDWLYDARLLHLVKRGIADKRRPGVRFDAYAVDYGCYVDLLTTRHAAPRGLFRTEGNEFVEVPPDDLEKIRGAILELDEFMMPAGRDEPREAEPFPTVTLRGHASVDHRYVESVPQAMTTLDRPGWYLLVESSRGILAVHVGGRAVRIGSATGDHLRISHRSVTPRHAVVEEAGGALILVRDKTTSVFVNEKPIDVAKLVDRDHVAIGEIGDSGRFGGDAGAGAAGLLT